jgi:type IV pilus assembly protein PilY1
MLIGGLRYGGKDISWTAGGTDYYRYPEYFALDITEPLNPRVLWSFSDPDLGLAMSEPTLVKIGTDWFAIFGSGATDFNTGSNLTTYQQGNIFVLKISGGSDGVISTWTEGTNFWKIPSANTTTFMASPITLDIDSDFNDDIVYIGENYQKSGNWNALMRRITTKNGTVNDPSAWTLSTFADIDDIDGNGNYDVAKRITSSASASMDNRGNVWVFFGTGQFLGTADRNQIDTGGFYAIKDGCWKGDCTNSYADLMDVSVSSVDTDGNVAGVSGSCAFGGTSSWSSLLSGSYGCDGWSIFFQNLGETVDFTGADLSHDGERVIAEPLVLGGIVTWTTYIPGIEECEFEGDSNLYAVYYKTGTSFKKYVFKEQKNQASPDPNVARVKHLGKGMPSSVSAQITDSGSIKGFAQQSTGSIAEIEQDPAFKMKSGRVGWIEEKLK